MPLNREASTTILLVGDAVALVQIYIKFLRSEQAEVIAVETLAGAHEFIAARAPTVILLDVNLPDGSGLDLLRDIRARGLETAVVVIVAHGSIESAVEAMREGADDFLVKPFPPERLSTTLKHVLERRQLAQLVASISSSGTADVRAPAALPGNDTGIRRLTEVERAEIERAIALCNGNLTAAAKRLDINVSTIHRKRQAWLAQASK